MTCNVSDNSTFPPVEKYGGRLKEFAHVWVEYTSDPNILDIVKNCHIDFEDLPTQEIVPHEIKFSAQEEQKIGDEIVKMLQTGVIEACDHEPDEYISPIFGRKKKDGSLRIILNLKELNKKVEYQHFKMDSRNMAAQLMTENSYMASIDLKQAYYLVPMAKEHRKYLKFTWKGQLFQFSALPNGLSCAPRLFTKLLKPIYATLREEGISILGYIDDTFLVAKSRQECQKAVNRVIQLLTDIGFVVHLGKSVLEPTNKIMFLGYIFDSTNMTITLSDDKKTTRPTGLYGNLWQIF